MSAVFSSTGLRSLRASWALLAVAVAIAIGLGLGGRWYQEHERRERLGSAQRLQQAAARLEAARRERDNLRESAEIFGTLVDRGLLQGERRLDMVEMVNDMRVRFQIASLDYEIAAQRPLQLPGARVFPSVDVLASRVRLKMRALHEGDVLGFIEALEQSRQGFFPVDRCLLRRVESTTPEALTPRVEAECSFEWITLKDKSANRPG